MTRKHSADDILQTIREMASTESGLHELNKWLTEAFFVVLTSPNATPEDRDRAWRKLEKKGYECDLDRPFSLRKRGDTEQETSLPTEAEVRRRFDILMDPDISPEEKAPIIETLIEWGWGDVTFRKG